MHYIIYHQVKPGVDCPDGIMAATIAWMAAAELAKDDTCFWPDCYRTALAYGSKPEPEKYPFRAEDQLTIVDFSYPAHWLNYWEGKGIDLTVIDHHAAKFPMLEKFSGAILDSNECGATLTWKHFFPDRPMPDLLKHVRRRDIGADGYYEGNTPESEAITEGLSRDRWELKQADVDRGNTTSVYTLLALENLLLTPNASELMLEKGRPLIAERDRLVEQAIRRSEGKVLMVPIDGEFFVPFVRTLPEEDRVCSQVGNQLAKRHPDALFAWVQTSDGGNHLRSTGFDVAAIAMKLGGGGHPRAAGF